jgi:hypothetical protein
LVVRRSSADTRRAPRVEKPSVYRAEVTRTTFPVSASDNRTVGRSDRGGGVRFIRAGGASATRALSDCRTVRLSAAGCGRQMSIGTNQTTSINSTARTTRRRSFMEPDRSHPRGTDGI